MKVLVINQHASNKGDRAILASVLQELARNEVSSVTVSVHDRHYFSTSPGRPNQEIKLIPWGWNIESRGYLQTRLHNRWVQYISYPAVRRLVIRSLYRGLTRLYCNPEFARALTSADLVISTGGHHVTTLLSPDAVSPQIYDMALALMAKKKLVLWSQSFGPFNFTQSANRDLVRKILSQAFLIYVRDKQSMVQLDTLGVEHSGIRETVDSVMALRDGGASIVPPSQREPILGISVYSAQTRSPAERASYVTCLAGLLDHAAERGYVPRFFPMELKGSQADDRSIIRAITAAARFGHQCSIIDRDLDTLEHIAQVSKCRLFVGHKTHSVIFSLISSTPVIAIAYHPKTSDFLNQYDLSSFCIPDRQLTTERLVSLFQEAVGQLDTIACQESVVSEQLAGRVRRDFREMLASV